LAIEILTFSKTRIISNRTGEKTLSWSDCWEQVRYLMRGATTSRPSFSSPLEQDKVTPAIGTSPVPNYIVVMVANGHQSTHKEYKKLAIKLVRDNL
jgi:hypothetical protein